jgi:choline dehydrogenase-like flavoprotein
MPATKVLIVGSGIAGATVAAGLLKRGVAPIVMLEAGPRVPMRDHRRWLDFLTTGATPYDHCRDSPADEPLSDGSTAWLQNSRLFARGGSTLHWGGWALRLRPEDFALRTATGRGADWPIGYADLEPWYVMAERALGVAGDSAEPSLPRSAPLPFAALPYTLLDGEIIRGFEALGYGYSPMPIARNVEARDLQPACQTIGTCRYCPIGARYTADQTLDLLEARPGFTLRTDTAVTAVLMDRREHVSGVEYAEVATGARGVMDAEVVIVCAGALESPKLLLNSANRFWPEGIGNGSGHVGRHLGYHPLLYARGRKPSNPLKLQQEIDFPTLCSRHFDSPGEQPAGKMFVFAPPIGTRLDLAALMRTGLGLGEVRRAVTGPHEVELQGFMELPGDSDARVTPGRGRNRFALPATDIRSQDPSAAGAQLRVNLGRMAEVLIAAGYEGIETGYLPPRGDHAVATCRMARSDSDGVVDPDLRVHGVENLYVCSNAVFPSGGAVNPTLTLAALAMRCAERLRSRP